jgi:hypothetical protein
MAPFCDCSYEIAGALGRDKLQGDAAEDAVGRHVDGQPALREQADGSGSLAGADGHASRTHGTCGAHRGRLGGTTEGTKGTTRVHWDSASSRTSVGMPLPVGGGQTVRLDTLRLSILRNFNMIGVHPACVLKMHY